VFVLLHEILAEYCQKNKLTSCRRPSPVSDECDAALHDVIINQSINQSTRGFI